MAQKISMSRPLQKGFMEFILANLQHDILGRVVTVC